MPVVSLHFSQKAYLLEQITYAITEAKAVIFLPFPQDRPFPGLLHLQIYHHS